MNTLEKRIIDLSHKHKLSHLSSCLNTVNLLASIYEARHSNEPVVLGNSHAALALYVVLEHHGLCDAEEMIQTHGVHAHRDLEHGIYVSGGSLGQAETIAVGLALADKTRSVWMVTSDGACAEGSVHESMRIARKHCPNLFVHVVFNGFGAYGPIEKEDLPTNVTLWPVGNNYPKWMQGLAGHYLVLSDEQHAELMAA